MTLEEFNAKMKEILENVSDVGRVSILLDEMRTGFNEETLKATTAQEKIGELAEQNKNLQSANMELFLKTGQKKEEEEEKNEEEESEKSFDDLFDEKGELK